MLQYFILPMCQGQRGKKDVLQMRKVETVGKNKNYCSILVRCHFSEAQTRLEHSAPSRIIFSIIEIYIFKYL